MKRVTLLLLLLPALALSQETVPLDVKGGGARVIEIDTVVIVKSPLTVVSSFPFSIHAPAGHALYFWSTPPGVTSIDKGDRLEVTSAPKGKLTISVKAITADWDEKKFITKFGSVSFAVGDITPDPIPTPMPPDPTPKPIPKPIDERYGLGTLAKVEAERLAPNFRALSVNIAANFEATAAKLAATSGMTVDQANTMLRDMNRATLSTPGFKEGWLPWFGAWATRADQLNREGVLTSPAHYVQAYTETALGLRAAK